MIEIFFLVILIFSLLGIVVIVWRKIPVLAGSPDILSDKSESISLKLKRKIKEFPSIKNFSYELFLQKFISKIRILTLKTDNQTFNWLQKLKERTKKKKLEEDGYWEEVKKIKK